MKIVASVVNVTCLAVAFICYSLFSSVLFKTVQGLATIQNVLFLEWIHKVLELVEYKEMNHLSSFLSKTNSHIVSWLCFCFLSILTLNIIWLDSYQKKNYYEQP